MKLVGVIPAKNEEDTIGEVLDLLKENMPDEVQETELLVVSSSTDDTERIVQEKGGKIVKDGGTGLGEAMYRGLKKALELEPDYIFSIDSDLQFQPDEIGKFVEEAGEADLILGSRFLDSGLKYDMSFSHRIGNKILTGITNFSTDLSLTDAQTGYRLMTPEVVEELRMVGRHTYVQETIIDANSNGFEIKEIPVEFHERENGGSKVVRSINRYALRTLPVLIHRSGYTPYLTNGFALFTGLIGFIAILASLVLFSPVVALISLVLVLASVQTFFFGMWLDGNSP